MPKRLSQELAQLQIQVEKAARSFGLDFFDVCYEVLDLDEINMLAAYGGFPVRYPHWKWGMEYERLKKTHDHGLGRIYEMVINNNPCYAFLLESNSFIDQKLVMCHVTGHSDFFKNNYAFRPTNRKMIDEMANHASRIRRYMDWYGVDEVEAFIDKVLSLDNLIGYQKPLAHQRSVEVEEEVALTPKEELARLPNAKEYMEHYINPDAFIDSLRKQKMQKEKEAKKFPKEPVSDILYFLMMHAPLTRWQRDVVDMLRVEACYFAPQAMTKIMNEGWAAYWHAKLMTERVMVSSELIDFADRHASVLNANKTSLNPYKLGIELYRDIEDRWNKGRFGAEYDRCDDMRERIAWDKKLGLGQKRIFEVRKIYDDVNFIDEFFTLDFCERHGYFSVGFDKTRQQYIVDSRDFRKVKQKLLMQLSNLGHPNISITDANFENRGEMLLKHAHDGVDLDVGYSLETLKKLQAVWTRPVHIITKMEDKEVLVSFDGENFHERYVNKEV